MLSFKTNAFYTLRWRANHTPRSTRAICVALLLTLVELLPDDQISLSLTGEGLPKPVPAHLAALLFHPRRGKT